MTAPYKILIADDEEDISWGISRSLAKSGIAFEVHCVNNGNSAFDLVRAHRYDLLISDIRMPGRSGLELGRETKKLSPVTKVILMTAHHQDYRSQAEGEIGVCCIEKPFDVRRLLATIFEVLHI